MSHNPAELLHDGALCRLITEHQAGDGSGDQQDRGDGEDRVVHDRGAAAQRVIIEEADQRVPHQGPGALSNHGSMLEE